MTLRTNSFATDMMRWYRASARDLPWRQTQDPYKIWISEVMLQQTTVNAVIPHYLRWIKQFPNLKSVASASAQTVLKSWQGLGYYSRARNIHTTAKIITNEFGGIFPSIREHVRRLPGLGPYTTGAVLSIAFDQREPIIDANVRRVVMRQLKISGKAEPIHDPKILEFLLTVMPKRNNRIFNQSIMELGALVCRSKNPSCLICPVKKSCLAYKQGVQDIIPQPKEIIVKNIFAAIAVIQSKNKYLLQRRPAKGLFADLWEFPGGKIEAGETAKQALLREVNEEIKITVVIEKQLPSVIQFYTQFKAHLSVWLCRPQEIPAKRKNLKWLTLASLKNYPMSSGTAKIVDMLMRNSLI